jgi:hypothetical protein
MPPPDDMMDDGCPHDPPPPSVAVLCAILGEDTLRQAWSVHPADNVFLRIPERRLPGFFGTMIFIRGVFALVVIIKLLTIIIPGAHTVLVTLDYFVGTTIIVLMAWRATHALALDLRERFQIEQLLVIPEGPQSLVQALHLRPLGAIVRLFIPYYIFSLSCLALNLLITLISLQGALGEMIPFLLLFIAFQGPWLVMLSHFILSASTDVINATLARREHIAVTLLRAIAIPAMGTIALPLIAMILLCAVGAIIGFTASMFPLIAILFMVIFLVAVVYYSGRHFNQQFCQAFANTAYRMNNALSNHWTQ